jgi:hypothetical protein
MGSRLHEDINVRRHRPHSNNLGRGLVCRGGRRRHQARMGSMQRAGHPGRGDTSLHADNRGARRNGTRSRRRVRQPRHGIRYQERPGSRPGRSQRVDPAQIQKMPTLTTAAAVFTATGETTTTPLPTTTKRSGSIRNMPHPVTIAATYIKTGATATAPLPNTTRRSGSIRNSSSLTTAEVAPTSTRATPTTPLPTTTRR